MFQKKLNQAGFSALIIVVVALVIGVIGFGTARVISSNNAKQSVNREADASQTVPITAIDAAILADAKVLKKVDFDLDGVRNVQDTDDDNDGTEDSEDTDDDNDGTEDDEDTEAVEATEAAELESPDQD